MELQITDKIKCNFNINSTVIAYDDKNNIYEVYMSDKPFNIGSCFGRIYVIVSDKKEVLDTVNPLMTAKEPYHIIEKSILEFHSKLWNKINP